MRIGAGGQRLAGQGLQGGGRLSEALALVLLPYRPIAAAGRRHAGGQAGDAEVGQTGQRQQHVDQRFALRRVAQHVQAIADLRRAQLAQIAVDILDQVGDVHAVHLGQAQGHAVFVQRVVPVMVMVVVIVAVDVMIMIVVVMAPMIVGVRGLGRAVFRRGGRFYNHRRLGGLRPVLAVDSGGRVQVAAMRVIVAVMMVMAMIVLMPGIMVMLEHRRQVGVELGFLDQIPDLLLQQRQLVRVQQLHLIVLVHQLGQLRQRAVAVGGGHRRRQVVDDHRVAAALGLRAFARIVDDEGVEQRHVAQ